MFNPSRTVVISLGLIALVGLGLGLATDVGLFGWSLAVLIALYLAAAGLTRLARPSARKPA
jgi:amino acid transporter